MPLVPGTDKDLTERLVQENIRAAEAKGSDAKGSDASKASAQDHQANLGPVIAQDIGEPASKEELKKRAEELNK